MIPTPLPDIFGFPRAGMTGAPMRRGLITAIRQLMLFGQRFFRRPAVSAVPDTTEPGPRNEDRLHPSQTNISPSPPMEIPPSPTPSDAGADDEAEDSFLRSGQIIGVGLEVEHHVVAVINPPRRDDAENVYTASLVNLISKAAACDEHAPPIACEPASSALVQPPLAIAPATASRTDETTAAYFTAPAETDAAAEVREPNRADSLQPPVTLVDLAACASNGDAAPLEQASEALPVTAVETSQAAATEEISLEVDCPREAIVEPVATFSPSDSEHESHEVVLVAAESEATEVGTSSVAVANDATIAPVESVEPAITPRGSRNIGSGDVANRKSHRVEPAHRGGGRFGTSVGANRQNTVRKPGSAELVCYRRQRVWWVAVEIADPIEDEDSLVLLQADRVIQPSSQDDSLYPLDVLTEPVIVQFDEEQQSSCPTADRGYLLFKMAGNGRGRAVDTARSGQYLAIVPDTWQRDEHFCSPAIVAPESTNIDGWSAHHFDLNPSHLKGILFRTLEGAPVRLDSSGCTFDLRGARFDDHAQNCGPLFLIEPPCVVAGDECDWQAVKTIVLGEEGPGRGKWRTDFSPRANGRELVLPSELREQKSGWFFLRLYDHQDRLLESLDFRFAGDLRAIRTLNPPGLLPPPTEFVNTHVVFEHEPTCQIVPRDQAARTVKVEEETGQSTLLLTPETQHDLTFWTFRQPGGGPVPITVAVSRLRWSTGGRQSPSGWKDQPERIVLEDLEATSDRRIWIRWPVVNPPEQVEIGFTRGRARRLVRKAQETVSALELRQFCDSVELRQAGVHTMYLWCDDADEPTAIGEFRSELACRRCDFRSMQTSEMLDHIASEHGTACFHQLTYEELRERYPARRLPAFIYRCGHCDFVAEADDPKNPTSLISGHVAIDCKQNISAKGHRDKGFVAITKLEEIRRHTQYKDLPDITVCTLCRQELTPGDETQRREHLLSRHAHDLYLRV